MPEEIPCEECGTTENVDLVRGAANEPHHLCYECWQQVIEKEKIPCEECGTTENVDLIYDAANEPHHLCYECWQQVLEDLREPPNL